MSGPALSQEKIEARRLAAADDAEYLEATAEDRRAERRAARLEAVRFACAPLNKRILHSRKSWRKRRAAAKRAHESRRRNRAR